MHFVLDRFNTEIFGINMVNLIDFDADITDKDVKDILWAALEKKYDNVCVKVDTGEKYLTNLFLSNGFELVDTQVLYSIPVHHSHFYKKVDGFFIKNYQNNDIDSITKIAKVSFKNDRFHSDPFLPTEKSDTYYEKWAENLCKGLADEIYVVIEQTTSDVVGFLSITYKETIATVGLASIKPEYQGNGLFTYMLSEIMKMQKVKPIIEYLYYGTQLSNIPVLRTMSKFNGFILSSNHVLHKMLNHKITLSKIGGK